MRAGATFVDSFSFSGPSWDNVSVATRYILLFCDVDLTTVTNTLIIMKNFTIFIKQRLHCIDMK